MTHLRLTALELTGGGFLEALGCARVGFQLWHRILLTLLLDNVIQNSMFSGVPGVFRVARWQIQPCLVRLFDVPGRLFFVKKVISGLSCQVDLSFFFSLVWLGDPDRGHAGGGGCLDADVGVLEDEALAGVDTEAGGGEEEGVGGGFAALIIARTDESVEEVEEAEGVEGFDDGLAGAAGDDGEGDVAVLEVYLLEDFGDGLELVDEVVVEALFAVGKLVDGDGEVVAAVELGDDVADGHAAPGVKEFFGEVGAAVLGEGLGPGDVVDGHGVGDGAVAVEEVGLEVAFGKCQGHVSIVSQDRILLRS